MLGQGQDPPFNTTNWNPWGAAPAGTFVAGIPKLDPNSAVRRVVAAWIRSGRINELPWETLGAGSGAC
jgi:hypothetical protein